MEDGDFLICHAIIVSMSNCQLRVMYLLKLRLCYPPQVFKIICLSKLISYDLYSWVDLRRQAHTPLYEKVNLLILYFDVFSRILLLALISPVFIEILSFFRRRQVAYSWRDVCVTSIIKWGSSCWDSLPSSEGLVNSAISTAFSTILTLKALK